MRTDIEKSCQEWLPDAPQRELLAEALVDRLHGPPYQQLEQIIHPPQSFLQAGGAIRKKTTINRPNLPSEVSAL